MHRACTGLRQMGPSAHKGEWTQAPSLTQKLFPTYHHSQNLKSLTKKKLVFPNSLSGYTKHTQRQASQRAVGGQHKTNSMIFLEGFCLIMLCLGIYLPHRSFAYILQFQFCGFVRFLCEYESLHLYMFLVLWIVFSSVSVLSYSYSGVCFNSVF